METMPQFDLSSVVNFIHQQIFTATHSSPTSKLCSYSITSQFSPLSQSQSQRQNKRLNSTPKMPTLSLFTNVPVDAVAASDILKDATKAVAKIVGKPESYVMIVLNGSVPIAFAGTEAPAAYGELMSIGGLGPSVNGKLSSIIAEILQTKLSIDGSRFYIKFYDVQRSFCGFNGSTF